MRPIHSNLLVLSSALFGLVLIGRSECFLSEAPAARSCSVLPARITGEEVQQRLQRQLERLREKDRRSRVLTPEELNIVYEDAHLIVIDKPAGILSVPSEPDVPSLAQTVFDRCSLSPSPDQVTRMSQMVVHRLGADTSGLIVFGKTMDAVRGLHSLFRTRKINRQYQVLVCGHVRPDHGLVNLPLMRDYEYPPYMRVSTDEHQQALLDLDPNLVGRKLLEAPKTSVTHYQVQAREFLRHDPDCPVTRLTLTSISGRTHQLNVHCAALGHPIVKDAVYGYQGSAAAQGGLDQVLSDTAASQELQARIDQVAASMNMCVHATRIQFEHPVTGEVIETKSPAPF